MIITTKSSVLCVFKNSLMRCCWQVPTRFKHGCPIFEPLWWQRNPQRQRWRYLWKKISSSTPLLWRLLFLTNMAKISYLDTLCWDQFNTFGDEVGDAFKKWKWRRKFMMGGTRTIKKWPLWPNSIPLWTMIPWPYPKCAVSFNLTQLQCPTKVTLPTCFAPVTIYHDLPRHLVLCFI